MLKAKYSEKVESEETLPACAGGVSSWVGAQGRPLWGLETRGDPGDLRGRDQDPDCGRGRDLARVHCHCSSGKHTRIKIKQRYRYSSNYLHQISTSLALITVDQFVRVKSA